MVKCFFSIPVNTFTGFLRKFTPLQASPYLIQTQLQAVFVVYLFN